MAMLTALTDGLPRLGLELPPKIREQLCAFGEAVVEHLRPIREESLRLMKDKAYLESVYRAGAEKASYVAEKTLRKVYKKVGFVAK